MKNSALIAAFIVSVAGHCAVFGMPGFTIPSSRIQHPKEILVNIEIEKPMLLPKVDVIGDEKKLKKMEEKQKTPESVPLPKEIVPVERPQETAREKIELIDPAQEEMVRYQDAVKQRIQESRRYPGSAKRRRIEGTVGMGFTVLSNGTGQDIIVMNSSGSEMLDEEAVQTIRRAGPFPPFPKELRRPLLRMQVAIVFSLQR